MLLKNVSPESGLLGLFWGFFLHVSGNTCETSIIATKHSDSLPSTPASPAPVVGQQDELHTYPTACFLRNQLCFSSRE